MRFCPFCSAENADEMAACQSCGRRLPPLPPRRAGSKGPPTGITLPQRAPTAQPVRPKGSTLPPPIPDAAREHFDSSQTRVDQFDSSNTRVDQFDSSATRVDHFDSSATRVDPNPTSTVDITSPFAQQEMSSPRLESPRSDGVPDLTSTKVFRDSAPALPPPPPVDETWAGQTRENESSRADSPSPPRLGTPPSGPTSVRSGTPSNDSSSIRPGALTSSPSMRSGTPSSASNASNAMSPSNASNAMSPSNASSSMPPAVSPSNASTAMRPGTPSSSPSNASTAMRPGTPSSSPSNASTAMRPGTPSNASSSMSPSNASTAMRPGTPSTPPALPRPGTPSQQNGARPPGAQNLLDALSPGPAAERRPAPPPDQRIIGDRRGLNAPPAATPPPAFEARAKSPSVPPPTPGDRAKTPSGSPLPTTTPLAPATITTNSGLGVVSSGGRAAFGDQTPLPTDPLRAKSPTLPPPRPGTVPPPPFNRPGSSGITPVPTPATPPGTSAVQVASTRTTSGTEPPPTRIHRPEALVDRPFTPPKVAPVPEIPEPSLIASSKYTYEFAVARWQRRGAIKQLGIEIKQDTEALDQVLGALGRAARGAKVEGRVFSAENAAITSAEERVATLKHDGSEVETRKVEENSKFVDVERERNEKLVEAERMVDEAQKELVHLEAQRRSQRDRRKELERRQKAYLKNADDQDRQAGSAPMGDQRQELRRSAEQHRKEAAALEPDKQEIDRRLSGLERPINEATARLDAAKAELDAAKRSLNDAREGHTHRLAELDAEQKRKAREISLAEAEIQRRLVTLGTLVNLNRIEDPQFGELYQRIDRLRGAITARTTEIEKLTAEREAYDRGTLVRGVATIGGVLVVLIALIVILRAIL